MAEAGIGNALSQRYRIPHTRAGLLSGMDNPPSPHPNPMPWLLYRLSSKFVVTSSSRYPVLVLIGPYLWERVVR